MEKKDFRILVADDDEIARDVITSLLKREGYAVLSALDGLDAIRILRVEDIGLVITDLRMPGADGIEVLKYAVRSNPDIAVVILTAYGTLDTTLEAIKEGAYDYLTKPFKGQEMILVADRAYKRMVLLQDNKELTRHLRETYRDMEILKNVVASGHPEVTAGWLERIERLKAMSVLTENESLILKERLIKGDGKGLGSYS
ncbi:MAG: response regulator [Nitrospiraceae bacterium]|nr:response regulator [Nitrospiraceae bacterium]